MCSFIILLLLLGCSCRNNGCEEHHSECSRDDYNRRSDNWRNEDRESRRRDDNDCRCNDKDDLRRNDDNDRRRGSRNNNDCSCSACEDAASDNSPIKEREDIWSPYLNASSGRQK